MSAEFVGPFSAYDVHVDGRRVPHLQAHPQDGGSCSSVTAPLLSSSRSSRRKRFASFVAFAMQVAERGVAWPRVHDKHPPQEDGELDACTIAAQSIRDAVAMRGGVDD